MVNILWLCSCRDSMARKIRINSFVRVRFSAVRYEDKKTVRIIIERINLSFVRGPNRYKNLRNRLDRDIIIYVIIRDDAPRVSDNLFDYRRRISIIPTVRRLFDVYSVINAHYTF